MKSCPNDLLLQFREKIVQIKELSLQFDLALLVQSEEPDAFQKEDVSGLGRKTYPPFHGGFITTDLDVQRVEFHLIEKRREPFQVSGDGLCSLHRRSSDRVFEHGVSGKIVHHSRDVKRH